MNHPTSETGKGDASPAENLLRHETSPYLLQHQDNPVHWRAWGPTAFNEAKETGKPIMLSIGYAACHWCHVMAHESFEDPESAAVMNRLFVNIKVDREERPDIDAIYQHALQMLGEQGGWPLTMFLTADLEPFWGGTYFPKEPRFGRPGFTAVLHRISEIYTTEPSKVRQNADALKSALKQLSTSIAGTDISTSTLDDVAAKLGELVDTVDGGIRGAPKFPQVPIFQFLWRAWQRTGDRRYRDAVCNTLDRMCHGGIYDHLGGGFARYSVDAKWLVPHFEKMLYDNAQLVSLLTVVWQETRSNLYAARVSETIEWLHREMWVNDCGFAGTLDADSEGEEGRFYVWSEKEIDDILGGDAPAFKAAYDVSQAGNWEGKTILNLNASNAATDQFDASEYASSRQALLNARAKRVRPALDDKILGDWNGLMISALVEAGLAFDRAEWIEAAEKALSAITARLMVDGRLFHSFRSDKASHPATLDDHAALAASALSLYEATGRAEHLELCRGLVSQIEEHFRDEVGGYFVSAVDVDDVLVRQKSAFDNATPSGNGMLLGVYGRLYFITAEPEYLEATEAIIRTFSGELGRNAFSLATFLNNVEFLSSAVEVILCGDEQMDNFSALRKAAIDVSASHRVLQFVGDPSELPQSHPAFGKSSIDGKAALYICRNRTCSVPITDPKAVASAIMTL